MCVYLACLHLVYSHPVLRYIWGKVGAAIFQDEKQKLNLNYQKYQDVFENIVLHFLSSFKNPLPKNLRNMNFNFKRDTDELIQHFHFTGNEMEVWRD